MKRIDCSLSETQLLVVTPTRELGLQIAQVAVQLSGVMSSEGTRHMQIRTAFGGQKSDKQKIEILKKPEVVVATPGRVNELLRQGVLDLSFLKAIVLDEADLMLGMGFESQIRAICDHLPKQVQAALFSATDSEEQTRLQNRLVHRGLRIDVRPNGDSEQKLKHSLPAEISHECVVVPQRLDKVQALIGLLRQIQEETDTGIIFCQTRESVQHVVSQLSNCGLSAVALSGELGQIERTTMLRRFKSGGVKYMVATNIAARGLDVSDLSVVVHFEIPSTQQEYLHRSGRSGRAGKSGRTISLCTPKSQAFLKELLQGTDVQLKELNVESPQPIDKQSNSDFVKIHLNRGKSSKIRPGDVLGALTQQCGLTRTEVGGIFIFDHFSHVEVVATKSISTLSRLSGQRMKNLPVRATLAETLSPARSRTF
jgi:ATP-independent RNA helicase DbpA